MIRVFKPSTEATREEARPEIGKLRVGIPSPYYDNNPMSPVDVHTFNQLRVFKRQEESVASHGKAGPSNSMSSGGSGGTPYGGGE